MTADLVDGKTVQEGIATKKTSDLGVRALSGIVMVAVAGLALWAGGLLFWMLCALVAGVVLVEYWSLVDKFAQSGSARFRWMAFGIFYVGLAAIALAFFRLKEESGLEALMLICVVIATDVGAYFAGRAIGGAKLAPRISPNKTWAGLIGAMIAATIVWTGYNILTDGQSLRIALISGPLMAIVAQMGDLFESWMKRRAGVKDSGTLIPGHGGVFDRVDGMLAVFFVIGLTHITFIWSYFAS
ncbi:phosphatidate cytidylyltransferase [Alterisphingorhabdus coralli]|uniref:Phosphatidate cytidylyltransferase n=1 Tax=Alterisphingorhabdus coralli TaxID=3071408 RepID=A0AA97F6T7_9SPHN|nr:phosphatidate cytidylyltransferase [Parasphingorhabdus sp. SCSIO 66989]WOE74332.1 phosphatidate cytidylyltransferase [Parasphingorhabdus sp. SCSIO 66989]